MIKFSMFLNPKDLLKPFISNSWLYSLIGYVNVIAFNACITSMKQFDRAKLSF